VHEEGKCVATSERAETESKVIKEAIVLPLELPIWVTKNPLTEPAKETDDVRRAAETMDAAMNDLQRAAARARPALAVLSAEIGEPSPDTVRALAIIEQMLGDIEAGRHPLDRPDDWPHRDRWPDRPHWDRLRWAIKTLAVASGTTAYCSPEV
jgi:hypothetical protein